jgi:hypothetical protein
MQPLSEPTTEADSNVQATSNWTREYSRVTWDADHPLHVSGCGWRLFLDAAAPLSSDVASTPAFFYHWPCRSIMSADVGSPRVDTSRSSRRGRREGERAVRYPTMLSASQARDTLVGRADEEMRIERVISVGASSHE